MHKLLFLVFALGISFVIACGGAEEPPLPPVEWTWSRLPSGMTMITKPNLGVECNEWTHKPIETVFSIEVGVALAPKKATVVDINTFVGGKEIDVEWVTWLTDKNSIMLGNNDSNKLIKAIRDDGKTLKIESDFPQHFSREYNLNGLVETMKRTGAECFE